MARYYFEIKDDEDLYADEEGIELQDQRAAEIEVANSLASSMHLPCRVPIFVI